MVVSSVLRAKEISFKNLEISKRRVSLVVSYERGDFDLWFEFDREIHTTPSLVALAVAPLCGIVFDYVSFDFEVTTEVCETLREFTKAEVDVPRSTSVTTLLDENREGAILSFSGGFDSIAAKALMPNDTHLVSLDLGGWFKREAEYFGRFNPITIKTNMRQLPDQSTALTRNNWLFMASGALLCSYHLNARYHTFGSILGERFSYPAASRRLPLLEAAGLSEAPITAGITELGTTRIMLQTHPEEIQESLKSLAGDGDRKQYYKQAMVVLLAEDLGLSNPIPDFLPEWDKKIAFNSSYTSALSTMYFIAKGRLDLIEPLYEDIPPEVIGFVKEHRLDFLVKTNTDFYEETPRKLRNTLFGKLSELDLPPYSERDWGEVYETRKFLKNWF